MPKSSNSDSFWIRHLLRRAGFGASPEDLQHYLKLGYEGTVEELLHPESVNDDALNHKLKLQAFDYTNIDDLQRWWTYRMLSTKRPLVEKMTLFWHGHFATSDRKVKNPYAMYVQNMLFRKLCMGNFHEMLLAVSKDPAMIVWLDNQQNRKGKPNENYAREIMELFTMGIGNYTEKDIKEAARAFTGWQAPATGFFFSKGQHDYGEKTFLGETGKFNGDDIVRILVAQKATSNFLARKLCKFFVADDPDEALVQRIGQVYMDSNYNIKSMLRAIFTDDVFLSNKSYHAKIKSPAEFVIGTLKLLQINELDAGIPQAMEKMGQSLFKPPNVKGWDGGPAWIATDKMMQRFNFAAKMSTGRFNEVLKQSTPLQIVEKQGLNNSREIVEYFLALMLDSDVPASTQKRLITYVASDINGNPVDRIPDEKTLDAKLRGLTHLIMTLPTYQLS